MKAYLIIFFFIFLSCTNRRDKVNTLNNLNLKSQSSKENIQPTSVVYRKLLQDFHKIYRRNRGLTQVQISSVIPTNHYEYLDYYSYSQGSEDSMFYFFAMDSLVKVNAHSGNEEILFRYLNLASFVDGEYAEGYFEDITFVIDNQKIKFCQLYPKLENGAKEWLEELYFENCK